jgi:tryptophan synthase beta subunit
MPTGMIPGRSNYTSINDEEALAERFTKLSRMERNHSRRLESSHAVRAGKERSGKAGGEFLCRRQIFPAAASKDVTGMEVAPPD